MKRRRVVCTCVASRRAGSASAWPCGFTLLEILIVIIGLAAVMTIAARCFHLLITHNAESRDFLDNHRQWLNLSEAFRRDAHAAARSEAADDGSELRLFVSESHVVRYRRFADGVERIDETAPKQPRTSRFRLWDGTAQFKVAPQSDRAGLTYRWFPAAARPARTAGQSPLSRELVLEAAVGRDRRFAVMK